MDKQPTVEFVFNDAAIEDIVRMWLKERLNPSAFETHTMQWTDPTTLVVTGTIKETHEQD